jgi:low temperature requirement protein LtrA
MTDTSHLPAGKERSASTLELFFDLVYVYAITQVVAAIHHDLTIAGLLSGAFLLFLLWWTWSIYTWTTNWTGTATVQNRLFLIAGMGATLFMAMAVPDAFTTGAQWFGIAFFAVRLLASVFNLAASGPYPEQRAAFKVFTPISLGASALILIGGFLDQPWLWVFWGAGAAIDVFSAVTAGKASWGIDARHFAERNGLFIIIALGESIVGIGLTAAGVERDTLHTSAILVAFIIAAALWWSYFDSAAPFAERYFKSTTANERGFFARDAYTVGHYPIVVGIVFFAVAAEDLVAHPDIPLDPVSQIALTLGVALVLTAMAAVVYRADRIVMTARLVAAGAIVFVGFMGTDIEGRFFAAGIAAIVIATLTWEHHLLWRRLATEELPATSELPPTTP